MLRSYCSAHVQIARENTKLGGKACGRPSKLLSLYLCVYVYKRVVIKSKET